MTVASLWKALDAAGCGTLVGVQDISNIEKRDGLGDDRTTLAVDLSIWICESLTSKSTTANHLNPALHLVYSRSVKLLSMGVKLVAVIEGKRRIRRTDDDGEKFRNRRNGSAFWEACKSCETMLKLLGVPVVRAKAEGEALCALLNERGIVDGVISNDGDCLLFGAKVVYTKFSLENLEKSQVIRYDLTKLYAVCNVDDDRMAEERQRDNFPIPLSREDLIAFALLTGSDLAGNGIPNVGGKKAIRFIAECKKNNPLSLQTAAIDELKSWARAAKYFHQLEPTLNQSTDVKCCSGCGHEGSKKQHLKHGCSCCGTEPGEPCFNESSGALFRKSLRAKALAIKPKFDPDQTVTSYMRPNDNQVPASLVKVTAATINMQLPQLSAFLKSDMIIRGRTLGDSRDYLRQSLSRLMARSQLFQQNSSCREATNNSHSYFSREAPTPKEITRKVIHHKIPSYEVAWRVNATLTDDVGNDVDGYDFLSIESQLLFDKRYPELAAAFQQKEVEEAKQGEGEQERRREFLRTLLISSHEPCHDEPVAKKRGRLDKQRVDFFGKKRCRNKSSGSPEGKNLPRQLAHTGGGDAEQLLRIVGTGTSNPGVKTHSPPKKVCVDLDEGSLTSELTQPTVVHELESYGDSSHSLVVTLGAHVHADWWPILTPRNPLHKLECNMGIPIAVTPLVSSRGLMVWDNSCY